MRDAAPTRRTVLRGALAAAVLTAPLTAGCTRHGGPDDGRAPDDSPAPDGSPTPDGRRTAGTGSVLAVKIDNAAAARPQTGLDAADVVYAEQVEGGLSRLMAVYATRLPKIVGPVRSARESDLELLRQFDGPTLAFSGAQRKLLPLIDRAPLRPKTPDTASGAFYRGGDKAAPHNLYLRPARLMSGAPGEAALTTGFRYGPAPAGGTVTAARTVRYPAARFTFTWSAGRKRWLVSMDGAPTPTAAGRRLEPATVVVQHVRVRTSGYHDVLGNYTPYTETVGTGRAEVLRDGRSFEATWTRRAAADGTTFTGADGAPVDFATGQVWVVFAAR
ncbi:DUF3048 domain-containing protein [Streptomyces sp. NPDC001228]|uniref:DUF3048 domain-containing protein n=1 Tax=Streptomyces sp. NPDC001228 TaxID=3154381 RepID=UPI0033290CB1